MLTILTATEPQMKASGETVAYLDWRIRYDSDGLSETYPNMSALAHEFYVQEYARHCVTVALDEVIRLFESKRLGLNSQFEAVDVLREDGIYQIVIEDLEKIRYRHVRSTR